MAEELGRRLWADLERDTCTLDEIVLALSARAAPQDRAYTRLPVLDEIVNTLLCTRRAAFHAASTNAGPTTAQHGTASALNTDSASRPAPLPAPPIIQLDGLGPSSGRTQLLYLAAARCLLGHNGCERTLEPREAAETEGQTSGPRERTAVIEDVIANTPGAVVWFDLYGNFSASRLRDILVAEKKRVDAVTAAMSTRQSAQATNDEELSPNSPPAHPTAPEFIRADPTTAALEALDHIHIFRPHSTTSLIATLNSLPSYLGSHEHRSQNRPLALVVLAGLSAFWWIDRHESELDGLGLLMSQQQPPDETENNIDGTEVNENNDTTQSGTGESSTMQQQDQQKQAQKPTHSSSSLFHTRWRTLTRAVTDLQRRFSVPVLASDMCLGRAKRCRVWRGSISSTSGSGGGEDKNPGTGSNVGRSAAGATRQISRLSALSLGVQPHLPASWTSSVSVRFLLQRVRRRWPVAISAVEIVEEQARRQRLRMQDSVTTKTTTATRETEGTGPHQAEAVRMAGRDAEMAEEHDDGDDQDHEDEGEVQGHSNKEGDDEEAGKQDADTGAGAGVTPNQEVTVSNLLINMHGSENWSRATWDALEPWWTTRRGVLRLQGDRIELSNETG